MQQPHFARRGWRMRRMAACQTSFSPTDALDSAAPPPLLVLLLTVVLLCSVLRAQQDLSEGEDTGVCSGFETAAAVSDEAAVQDLPATSGVVGQQLASTAAGSSPLEIGCGGLSVPATEKPGHRAPG